jgi:hypothetical protein
LQQSFTHNMAKEEKPKPSTQEEKLREHAMPKKDKLPDPKPNPQPPPPPPKKDDK